MAGLAIIGGGPAGLMAAEAARAASPNLDIHVFEAKPSLGRKFLMAGKSGLNITHEGDLPDFLARYGRDEKALHKFIEAFPPAEITAWMEALGSKAVIGSSGLVFPKQWKASPLLRRWLARLDEGGVQFHTRHVWHGWDEGGALLFDTPEGPQSFVADRWCLLLAGRAGRALALMVSGRIIWRRAGLRSRLLQPAMPGCGLRGRIFSKRVLLVNRLKMWRFPARLASRAGRRWLPNRGLRAVVFML